MILKMDEVMEVRNWNKVDTEDGITLEITLYNDQWYKYVLDEREQQLFKHGFNPEVVLRSYEKDMTPEITVCYWKHYSE